VTDGDVGSGSWLCCFLFIMGPHPDHLNRSNILEYLVNQAVVYVDAPRVSTLKITNKFLKRRWILKRVQFEDFEQLLDLRTEIRRSDLFRILLRLLRKIKIPTHQTRAVDDLLRGSFNPLRIEARMPEMDRRYNVSWMLLQSSSETNTALPRLPVI